MTHRNAAGTHPLCWVGLKRITYSTSGRRKKPNKNLSIAVKAIKEQEDPVSGAVVSISVALDGSAYGTATGTTGSGGTVTFVASNSPSGFTRPPLSQRPRAA